MSAAAETRNGSVKLEHPTPTSTSAAMDVDDSPAAAAAAAAGESHDSDESEDDEIVSTYPVYLHNDLIHHLYLLASPFRPAHRPYAADVGPLKAIRVKPNQKRVEINYTIHKTDTDTAHSSAPYSVRSSSPQPPVNYDPSSIHPLDELTLAGRPVPCKTNYAVGVWSDGTDEAAGGGPALHLTPLFSTLRLKPELSYLDDEREEEAAMLEAMRRDEERGREEWNPDDEHREADDDEDAEEKKAAVKPEMRQMTVRFKKKETEKSAAYRTASHAYIKQMEEKEQWITLTHHTQQSPLAQQQRALLATPPTQPTASSPQPVPMNDREYLAYLNPTAPASNLQLTTTGDRVLSLLRSTRSLPFYRILQKLNVRADGAAGRDECWRWCERFGYYVQHSFVIKSVLVFDAHLTAQAMEAAAHPAVKTEREREREREHSHRMASRVEMARDYLVCQFYRAPVVYRDKVASVMRLDVEQTEERLRELSERRQRVEGSGGSTGSGSGSGRKGGWEWKWHEDEAEVRCISGVSGHAQLLKQQEEAMKQMERRALWALEPQLHSPPIASTSSSSSSSLSLSSAASSSSSFASSTTSAHSAALTLLTSLFRQHGVCSESYLLSQFHSSPPTSPLASLTTDAFRAILTSFSLPITPQLFIRKTLSNPAVDRYRSVIASLFAVKAAVKKSDVQRAIEECYGDEIPDNLYRKVMKEFATFHTGLWTLKTGNY